MSGPVRDLTFARTVKRIQASFAAFQTASGPSTIGTESGDGHVGHLKHYHVHPRICSHHPPERDKDLVMSPSTFLSNLSAQGKQHGFGYVESIRELDQSPPDVPVPRVQLYRIDGVHHVKGEATEEYRYAATRRRRCRRSPSTGIPDPLEEPNRVRTATPRPRRCRRVYGTRNDVIAVQLVLHVPARHVW